MDRKLHRWSEGSQQQYWGRVVGKGRGGKRLKATGLAGGAAADARRRAAACEIWHS